MASDNGTQREMFGQGDEVRRCECGNTREGRSPLCPKCRKARMIAYQKERYNERKSHGLCTTCPGNARPGKVHCDDCAAKIIDKRKTRKRQGLCTNCDNPPTPGRRQCEDCRKETRRGYKAYYQECKKIGKCLSCPGMSVPGSVTCNVCAEKIRQDSKKLRLETFAAYGGAYCCCCGTDVLEFLTLDHVDRDGAEHRRSLGVKGGGELYRKLKKQGFPQTPRLTVKCFNCNSCGVFGKGECPHVAAYVMTGDGAGI